MCQSIGRHGVGWGLLRGTDLGATKRGETGPTPGREITETKGKVGKMSNATQLLEDGL